MDIKDHINIYQSTVEQSPPELNFRNSRQYHVQQFVDNINRGRVGTKYKPVTWTQINGMVAHLKGFELTWFLRECEKAKNFSSYFFYKLKKK